MGLGAKSALYGAQAAAKPAAGGFVYGAASGGGSLFGAASAAGGGSTFASGLGGGASKAGGAGGFAFGQASSFGGLGGASAAGGLFGASAAAPADDPYNIPIDLTKIKRAEKPAKTFEEKTSEEKIKTMQQLSKEIEATGAKSIMKTTKGKKTGKVAFGQCLVYEYDKDPGSNEVAKRVDSKDISDMRDEKTKMRDLLQEQENKQLAEFKRVQEMMNKKTGEANKAASPDKFKSSALAADKVEDSIAESASLSQSHDRRKDRPSESYDTDTFEEASASKEKGGINYWPGKAAMEGSVSVSSSRPVAEAEVFSTDAMEEYLKKQAAKKVGGPTAAPAARADPPKKDFSESSDKYTDEDFESMSKSQGQLAAGGLPKLGGPKPAALSAFSNQTRIAQTYVRKENKFVQTDLGKYSDESVNHKDSSRYLQRELEDAERLIQQQKGDQADYNHDLTSVELQLKKAKMEKDLARHEALNANATNERMKQQLKDQMHKINLYKIETEELIKQIDMADAKTRQKEDELNLMQSEYDRKMQLQEKQIEFRRAKQDNREIYEVRREHQVQMEELKQKMTDVETDVDYFKTKTEKLEVENSQLRVKQSDNKRIRELENELELLKDQLKKSNIQGSVQSAPQQSLDSRSIKKSLSPDEQVQLQREMLQLDLMLKGYEGENQKLMNARRSLDDQIKDLSLKLNLEQQLTKSLKLKAMAVGGTVLVEAGDKDDVPIMNQNVFKSKAISEKELAELHKTVKESQGQQIQAKKDILLQAEQFKAQISKARDEKSIAEQNLLKVEFLVGEKEREVEKMKNESSRLNEVQQNQIQELQEKITWFRQNQKLIGEDEESQRSNFKENNDLKLQLQKAKEDKKRIGELEKKCRLLEDTIQAKNPNSIGMLIQAAKTDVVRDGDSESKRQLEMKISQLNYELEAQEQEFEKKLRTMRQEQERIKDKYQNIQGQSAEAKQAKLLEEELVKTKSYYTKRIREIEDKYKYGMGKTPVAAPKSNRSNSDLNDLRDQNDRLTKERNLLAQKVVDFEAKNNQRRQSIPGAESQEIKNMFYQPESPQKESPQKPPKGQNAQLNPFNLDNSNQKPASKSIPELLDLFSKINFQSSFPKPELKINELYNILSGELQIPLTVSDLKNLNKYLLNKQNEDVEFLGKDENLVDLDFLKSLLAGSNDQAMIRKLQDEIRRLKQNQNDEVEFVMGKSQKLQREISEADESKRELQQKVNKLEAQKSRLEQVFKSTMKGGNSDLIDEVQMLVRRIEFLEEQSEKRAKSQYLENQEPYVREIDMLRSKLSQEREIRDQIVQKKNAEVSYFKAELDALLSEMSNQIKKKQASRVQ